MPGTLEDTVQAMALNEDKNAKSEATLSHDSSDKETNFLDSFINDIHDLREGLRGKIVNVQDRDARGQTLLHRAIVTRGEGQPRRDVVALLLEADADPNALDKNGLSPFMYDAFNEKCHFECFLDWVEEKPERTLSSNACNKLTKMTVMMHVAGPPRTPFDARMVTALSKGDENKSRILGERDSLGRTALFYAVISTHQHKATRDVFRALIQIGFNISDIDIYGQNIAHVVASNPDINADILELAFEQDKDKVQAMLQQHDVDENTPAHIAGEAQNAEAFSKIKGYLPGEERNNRQETALMCLCKNLAAPSILRRALEGLKLDRDYVNAVDDTKNTALSYALVSMSAAKCTDSAIRLVTKLLADIGVDIDESQNNCGMSASRMAIFLGNSGFLRYVMGRGVQIS